MLEWIIWPRGPKSASCPGVDKSLKERRNDAHAHIVLQQCDTSRDGINLANANNPSNAVSIFDQSTRTQNIFENHLNPVMLVFKGYLSPSTFR